MKYSTKTIFEICDSEETFFFLLKFVINGNAPKKHKKKKTMKHIFFPERMKCSTKIIFFNIIQYFLIFIKEFIILYNWML